MLVSSRAKEISESITLKLNAKAQELQASGRHIFNLTAGQLPFRPMPEFVDQLRSELNFLKSFQYSPVPGNPELKEKLVKRIERTREIKFPEGEFGCVISNGGKHTLYNIMAGLIDPGDEVVIFAPYWISYPEMIKLVGGVPVVVNSSIYDAFLPSMDDIKKSISEKTKLVIVNSPNNPAGIHYSDDWMANFAGLMKEYPHVNLLSDEIYYELNYYDPKPTYFYQHDSELLKRTIIVDGISKTMASTGLRIGYCVAPVDLTKAIGRIQGQTASGANSLVQNALNQFDLDLIPVFLGPIKDHLRANAEVLREVFREANLSHAWYQSTSAFYYLIDFSQTPLINKYKKNKGDNSDYAVPICEEILEKLGVAIVPGSDFGVPNSARISLVLEKGPFSESLGLLVDHLVSNLNFDGP